MPPVPHPCNAGKPALAAGVVGLLVVAFVGAVALGALGAPSVEGIENRFGDVSEETTVIHTDLAVSNPNPVGIRLGDVEIEYTVRMNDVAMAEGGGVGLDLAAGSSVQEFETAMDNRRIPGWWASHVENDERTVVGIDATVHTSILGERSFDLQQERAVETDVIGDFNSEETRPMNAESPPPTASNPILYVNRTTAAWAAVTTEQTPIDMRFEVYNPQLEPYVVTEVGYDVTMNDLHVGSGETSRTYVIEGGSTETVETRPTIDNTRLDDWWVTHLENDQVTELRVEFYADVRLPTGDTVHLPLEEFTYEETIETDIFDEGGDGVGADGGTSTAEDDGASTADDGGPSTSTPPETPTPTPTTAADDGSGDGGIRI